MKMLQLTALHFPINQLGKIFFFDYYQYFILDYSIIFIIFFSRSSSVSYIYVAVEQLIISADTFALLIGCTYETGQRFISRTDWKIVWEIGHQG